MFCSQDRKREENLRKRKEERKQHLSDENRPPSPSLRDSTLERKRKEANAVAIASQQVKVNFGEGDNSLKRKKAKKMKEKTVEEERLKAEQKLERRLKRSQEKEKKYGESESHKEEIAKAPFDMKTTKSFGGFTDLLGNIVHVNITKVVKKLGIAIDGGANTKQKAVIIREISVSIHSIIITRFPLHVRYYPILFHILL